MLGRCHRRRSQRVIDTWTIAVASAPWGSLPLLHKSCCPCLAGQAIGAVDGLDNVSSLDQGREDGCTRFVPALSSIIRIINKSTGSVNFYRAMHFSVKRGIEIAIACRPSVRPSVRNVGGSGPHRLEILETNCTNNLPDTFALRSPKAIHLIPREHGEIWGRVEVGWKKWRSGAQKWQYLWNAKR